MDDATKFRSLTLQAPSVGQSNRGGCSATASTRGQQPGVSDLLAVEGDAVAIQAGRKAEKARLIDLEVGALMLTNAAAADVRERSG